MNIPEHNNPKQHDAMLAELGIGPVWKLRETNVDADAHSGIDAAQAGAIISPEIITRAGQESNLSSEQSHAQFHEQSPDQAHRPLTAISVNPSTSTAELDWGALEARVSNCRACHLCEGRAKTVFGVGDQHAKWLFVGEGPGYNENLQGLPFVGPAGQLLDNILRALGMQRGANTYIANIVKCRPTDAQGKDRAPAPEEVAACLPYLKRQIALIQPEIIIALGKTAAISLLDLNPETPVGKLRGSIHHYQDLPLVVTYHPAYLLRKPTEKSKTWEDLCLALQAIAQTTAVASSTMSALS